MFWRLFEEWLASDRIRPVDPVLLAAPAQVRRPRGRSTTLSGERLLRPARDLKRKDPARRVPAGLRRHPSFKRA